VVIMRIFRLYCKYFEYR